MSRKSTFGCSGKFGLLLIVQLRRSLDGNVKSCPIELIAWTAALSLILVGWSTAPSDPGKDESGKGRWRGGYERRRIAT